MTATIKQICLQAISGVFLGLLLFSCTKKNIEAADTYPAPPAALVKFLDGNPSPALGSEGSVVTFNVNGLKGKEGLFKFFINQMEAEVVAANENTVTVKVPVGASSGGSAVLINGEYYFGPTFTVKGKVSIDATFNPDSYGSNGWIKGIIKRSDNTSYMVYGSFTNYQNLGTDINPVTGMAVLDLNCAYQPVASQMKVGKLGIGGGSVNSLIQQASGQYLVAGSFSSYDITKNVNNITRLTSTGLLDTQVVNVVNLDPINYPNDGTATVPAFNGGTLGNITKMFYNNATGNTIIVGDFGSYVSTFYERSTKNGPYLDMKPMHHILRMNATGALDSTYHYDAVNHRGKDGGNGFVYDAVQQSDNKVIIAGNFTSFDGKPASYLVRINDADGQVDNNFNKSGAGPDGPVGRITQNTVTGRMLLTGNFKTYNGWPANGVVMIKADGTVDSTFRFGKLDGGYPTYSAQLSNGKVIVSGSFNKYNYDYTSTPDKFIVRPGFMVLESNGSLAAGYNNTGLFRGTISDLVQITTNGTPGLILVGDFDRFDNKTVSNIVKLKLDN